MTAKTFIQVFIKSEEDLPKESGYYFAHFKEENELIKENELIQFHFEVDATTNVTEDHDYWMDKVDWYLQPLKQEQPERVEMVVDVNFLLTNALRHLDDEQLKCLADSIYERIPKPEKATNDIIFQNARCSECNELIGTNAAHICQHKFEPKSIFTRRRIRNAKTYDFVVKHKVLIYQCRRCYGNFNAHKNDYQLQNLIELARKEIGYSDKTWSGDIFNSLVRLYKKICVE